MNSFGQPSFFDYFAEIHLQFHFTGETYNTRQMTSEEIEDEKDLKTKMNLSYGQNTNLLTCKNVKY